MRHYSIHIAVFFLLLMLGQSLHKALFMGYFQLNRTYITQTLCVNKANPELKCDGKCHLKKYVAQAEPENLDQNKELPRLPGPDFLKELNLILFLPILNNLFLTNGDTLLALLSANSHNIAFSYTLPKGRDAMLGLLRPPIA